MLTLFMSITGGVDWEFAMEPLMGSLGKAAILDERLVIDARLVKRSITVRQRCIRLTHQGALTRWLQCASDVFSRTAGPRPGRLFVVDCLKLAVVMYTSSPVQATQLFVGCDRSCASSET